MVPLSTYKVLVLLNEPIAVGKNHIKYDIDDSETKIICLWQEDMH